MFDAEATEREIAYVQIPNEDFIAGLTAAGMDPEQVGLLDYLFTTVLDGRNAYLADGVERALGRPARDFRDYARRVAATGVWNAQTQQA